MRYDRPAAWSHSERLMQTVPVFTWASLLHPNCGHEWGGKQKQLLRPDVVQVTGVSDTLTQTLMSLQEETRLYPLSSLAACSSALSEAADPSNRWEATTAWWDMLFLTTSPFLHSVISWKEDVVQTEGKMKTPATVPAVFSHLLLEVAPLLFVDQHQVQVVAHRELLVDVSHRGGQVVAGQEQPDGNGLA